MALPTNLAAKIKAVPMDPTILASDLQLAYLLSFSQQNITHDSIYTYPRQSYQSPLEHYQFADFQDATYDKLLEETARNFKSKNKQLVRGIRCGFKEFYARVAANTYNTSLKFMNREKTAAERKFVLAKEEEEFRIEALKGNNPAKWPDSIKDFVKQVSNLPWSAFANDSELIFNDFIESAKNAILNLCKKPKLSGDRLEAVFKQNLTLQIQGLLGVTLRINNQSYMLEQLKFISELSNVIELKAEDERDICGHIAEQFEKYFGSVPKESVVKYHCPDNFCSKEPFVIMKKVHFQKYSGLTYYTIATDGKYLYIYVSAINGGMFKVGTGQKGSKAGQVYLEKKLHFPIGTKVDEVSWVYLKGKLYLKTSSKDPWVLQVRNPVTFEKQGSIQLFCPALFGHQSLINLNKNSPLLTDGTSLFYLGNRIKITKSEQQQLKAGTESKQQKSPEKQVKSPEKQKGGQDKKEGAQQKKRKKAKKNEVQNNTDQQKNQNYHKILEVVLYEFSFDAARVYNYEDVDQKDIEELYDSFSGYFTKPECRRAFVLNNYDLAEACQWLFNEGEKEKEKGIKIYEEIDYVILAEAEITSNFQEKNIKGPADIAVKEGSTLAISNINESIWTMDRDQIVCYSQNGIKIFSKHKADSKAVVNTKLFTTLLKTLQTKFPKSPEFCMTFDPYNSMFYTFCWPQDGHYFPSTVLVSSDKKSSTLLQQQKTQSVAICELSRLSDMPKFALRYTSLLDRSAIKSKYRFNDWMWYYGQKVIEISAEMNLPEASDKKRLSNKRTKVLTKMNKINETEKVYERDRAEFAKKNKVVKSVVKIYPFDAEGTPRNYYLITEAFRDVSNRPEQIYLFVLCLQNWLMSCPSSPDEQIKKTLVDMGETLFRLKEASTPTTRSYINKLLFQEFYLFFPNLQRQIKLVTSLSEPQLKLFLQSRSVERGDREEIVYEVTKKDHLIQKYETNKCEFAEIFKVKSNVSVSDNSHIEHIGNVLLSDLLRTEKEHLVVKDKIDQNLRRAVLDYALRSALEGETGNQFIQFLFMNSLKLLTDNCKDSHLFIKYQSQVFVEIFRLYEKLLGKGKIEQLYDLLPTVLLVIEIYHASLVPVHPVQEIVSSLLKIIEYLLRPEFNQFLSSIEDIEFEGISSTSQKIYETSHPLERGKSYTFLPKTYPNASVLLLEMDKRCQSDPNNDTLHIQLLHEDSAVANHILVNDGVFNSFLRLSGVVDTKKPYLLFGNALSVQFTSSGQVKDSQSLVRYGFKFGMRPVFAGRYSYDEKRRGKVQKIFGSVSNCENYVNTLKFAVVAASNTIENYLYLENEQSDGKINDLLKGKIFKEGFEDSSYRFDASAVTSASVVDRFISKVEQDSNDRAILKKSHEKSWVVGQAKKQQRIQERAQLWNFQNIPTYIKGYLQQIKQFKGDFIEVFTQARELAKQKGAYAHILRRKIFQENHKQFWLQGEAILFLTILKHSGLLHLNLKFSIEYIKENLKAFEDARDGIYYSFISRIQNVNEWRDLMQTYTGKSAIQQEKKEEQVEEKKVSNVKEISLKKRGVVLKTVKLGTEKQKPAVKKEKIEEKLHQNMNRGAFDKLVRERLSNNQSLIKGLCALKSIRYEETNPYDTVTKIIDEIIKASEQPLESADTAYIQPIQHLIRSCLFLLKFKSPSTKQSLESNQAIVPINLSRSLSSDHRNVDTNKLNLFREWLQNWKKWKGFKKEGKIELKFPVEEIVKYINSWIEFSEIEAAITIRHHRCENRIQFYCNNAQLIRLMAGTSLVKYAVGAETLNINLGYNSDLSSISSVKLKELDDAYGEFRTVVKTIENGLMSKLPLSFSAFDQVLKNPKCNFLQKMNLLGHTLSLLESENPEINLDIILYFISFKYLSNQHEDLIYLSNMLVQRAFISEHRNDQILALLNKEVGGSNVAAKRWKDFFFIERVLFLLRKLQVNCRRKVSFEEKIRIGETLFYVLYHIEIPLVAKLCLKIIRKLEINLKQQGIRTPLERQYKIYHANAKQQLALKQSFKLSNGGRNNVELLCTKIDSIFTESSPNQLSIKFAENRQKVQEEPRYNIILNLHQEEDLYWLIKVLYYLDQLDIKNGEKTIHEIKDWDEYLLMKGRKKEDRKNNPEQQNNPTEPEKDRSREQQRGERLFTMLPKYSKLDSELEAQLPVGWYFNYCNVFSDPIQKSIANAKPAKNVNANPKPPRGKNNPNNNNNNNPNKKNWVTPLYTKLVKKYEQLNSKPVEQPKQTDPAQLKSEYVAFKNCFNRIRRYFMEINVLIDSFSRTGYCIFREDVSRTKMNQICQMIMAGSLNRLRDIPISLKNNEVKTRLLVNEFVPNFSTKMKITLIKTKHYAYFDGLLSNQNNLHGKSEYYTALGKRELSLGDSKAYMPYQEFIPFDDPTEEGEIEFGKQWIENNFSKMKKKYEKVYLNDYPNASFFLAQGGIESGVRDNILVPANDHFLTLQTSSYDKIQTEPKFRFEKEYEQTELPEELIEKIQTILQRNSISIESKVDIRDFLLLTFYLKKLNNFDLECIPKDISKEFAARLFKFSSGLNSYKQLALYEEDVQKLILKLIDNEHEQLHLFGNYIPDDDCHEDVLAYLVPLKLEKLNSSNEVKQQTAQTHCCTKSKYLLKSQPPQIEQNKLLKYWQKSILPKILEFVKTTLKPIEIEDFWEQMRRPLRVNDHTEAKRVAYIICDNKLPNGAVIPDASHNWNSLEIEEIFVGENVLVKLPKGRGDFCTPLLGWGSQESRLAKVVFIDTKNSSVLVRYRVEELALFSFTWVPINALMAVEKEVMHISTKSIYEELEKKLEGIIYMHAKQCLTKLAAVSQVDNVKLIRETILDLFINNPIAGCFDFPKPSWSMRPIFEKMLEEKNFTILDMLEQQFTSIKGIDLNLNSESMTSLNRFEGAKALVVSFKKEAKLSQCSGIRFFSDKYGYNEVAHVYTAKSERTDIEPLEFNEPNIYCSFYANKECLPIVEQNCYRVHPIEATIFAVDDMWTIGCYLGQVLCEIATAKSSPAYLEVLQRINRTFIGWILKKSVSVLCSYLSKLISKICLTITYICERNGLEPSLELMGITSDQLKNLVAWINKLANEENKEVVALYTSLLQNLSEMAASILLKLPAGVCSAPEHVKAQMELIGMFKQIDNFTKTKKISLQVGALPTYQWERILQISNVPAYFSEQTVLAKIKEIIQLSKGKILCPAYDIFLRNGTCFILVDGWDINELVEEEVIEKMEKEEEEEEKQEEVENETGMMTWFCPACTYENPLNFNLCEMCQSPAPVAAKSEQVYDVVQATDLKAAEQRLRQRESKRFQEVKVQIVKFFQDEYRVVCDLVDKKNKEVEETKNKEAKKNKKAEGKEQLREVPPKPAVLLQTGSAVFKNQAIEQFLQFRFEAMPEELKRQVEDEGTFLGKFRKLLGLGFDLWGDNIYSENATLIPFSHLYLLMDYIQSEICKGSSSVLSYSEESIRILSKIPLLDSKLNEEPINYTSENDIGVRVKYKPLADFKSYNIRYSWKLVKELNLAGSKCLQFINMDLKYDKERNDTCPVYNDSLGYKLKYFRNLIMGVIKLELFQKVMQKTSVPRENDEIPKIYLERLKTRDERAREGLVTVKQKEDHLFTKAHDQFLKISPAFLRPFKPKGTDPYLSFTVTFKGENVMGEAGPYRQFFTDISRELEPAYNLGLFIPSPNNRHQSGDHKSKWVINPKANSTYHFSLFEYVGILMGCCFRTGGHLALDLPTMFWKSITHEEITEQDLEEIDSQLISMIRMLKDCPSQEALNEAMDATNGGALTWTFRTSDDEVHEIIPNGRNVIVEFAGLNRYIEMLKLKKINQSKLQVKRILQGLSQLIPLPYLHCLTGEELKLVICGRPKVDVDLLKRHTKYSGGLNEQSRRIKFFWEIMRQLVQIDRLKIIRFCWGQQRLPINSEQFQRNNIRFMIKPMLANAKNQDQALPKADTCFFNIQLPDYSTKQIMKEKILLAVNLDNVSINADDNINNEDNPLMNEIDSYDPEEDYEEENVYGGGGG